MVLGRILSAAVLLGLWTAASAQTVSFDSSGNGLLKGRSYFRQVFWITNSSGGLTRAISLYGTIDYDGGGNYSIDTQAFDSNVGQPIAYKYSGTYVISSSGYGSIQNPVATDTSIFGLVSNGVFVGSSTGGAFSDLFISAPLASPVPTASSLRGTYTISHIDFNSSDPRTTRSFLYQLNADGAGNLGNVSISGSIAGNGRSEEHTSELQSH